MIGQDARLTRPLLLWLHRTPARGVSLETPVVTSSTDSRQDFLTGGQQPKPHLKKRFLSLFKT